jgi:hypothetical protein
VIGGCAVADPMIWLIYFPRSFCVSFYRIKKFKTKKVGKRSSEMENFVYLCEVMLLK